MATTSRMLDVRDDATFMAVCEQLLLAGTPVRFRASGGSMRPAIRNGDVVRLDPIGHQPAAPGDIVAVHSDGRFLVHRVLSIDVDASGRAVVITRGDAHADADPPVPATAVLGRVTRIHRRTVVSRLVQACRRIGGVVQGFLA